MFEFLEKSVPITSQQWSEDTVPLVSIDCITYNHENFIRDAIEGFLMQKTTFPVEILIHDDASTDKTASIVREYEEKYPHLIKPIYQTENQYSKRDGSIGRIQRGRARGKYHAICEGDDYWIDPLKLQKQVDFLESNHDYGLVHTNSISKKNEIIIKNNNNKFIKDGFIFEDLITHKFFIYTPTVCIRTNLLLKWFNSIEDIYIKEKWEMLDYPLWLEGSSNTKFKYFNDVTACYRILPESASHSRSKYKRYLFYKSVYDIKFYFTSIMELNPKIIQEIKTEYYKGLLSYGKYNLTESTKGLIYLVKKKALNLRMFFVYLKNILF